MEEPKFSVSPRVIKKDQVRPSSPAGTAAPASPSSQPAVRLREENGVVRSIEVTCPCGSKIVLDCEYGDSAKAGS